MVLSVCFTVDLIFFTRDNLTTLVTHASNGYMKSV